ncbi:PQQ-dependent sugar dehydrogenase [Rhodococcus erythropolis]|uniref:PQQ-dependent sugar dehydrogenase n=1 Tax=Rhodococcus erythropolis TaxID=1833 RepID=UPI002227C441|nr:PQQ-dependent sugar dehydrogenase [Rhodococcus erythropolis]MCW2295458.1 glucose/arabinose dehydrogenase [Rhodococcus erythropolis]
MSTAGLMLFCSVVGCAQPAGSEDPSTPSGVGSQSTLVDHLDVPWDLASLPDRSSVLTLRDAARVVRFDANGVTPLVADGPGGIIADVVSGGSAGLRGVAASPNFTVDRYLFFYMTTGSDDRVVRYTLRGDRLVESVPIVTGIPHAGTHTGGRIRFGPDGMLYIGTGDPGGDAGAQNPYSLGGKILRVDPSGAVPVDNPIPGSWTWSLGHRNPQGFDWDDDGRMFASEFGQNRQDELNIIVKGGNYGWPEVEGIDTSAGSVFEAPVVTWTPADASPSGITVVRDTIYIAALRGERLWRVPLRPDGTVGDAKPMLDNMFGRLRAVEQSPDGTALRILTNNTHAGSPRDGDDRVVEIELDTADRTGTPVPVDR